MRSTLRPINISANITRCRTDQVVAVRSRLDFAGYAKAMAAIDILIELCEKVALVEINRIWFRPRCAKTANVSHTFFFMALRVPALDKQFGVVGARCPRDICSPAPV